MPEDSFTQFETDLCRRLEEIADGGPVALAVSGGSDSLALMYAAAAWCRTGDAETSHITILTVDHGLRPEAAKEAADVGQQASAHGFGHVILKWEGKKPSSGLSAAARNARYDLMASWCRDNRIGRLVLAHTLDDQAETVMMRLMRGSGVDGLSAMAPETTLNGIVLVRPFLDVTREDLRGYLGHLGRNWTDDPSNENEDYERVRVRRVLSELSEHGLTAESLGASARRLHRARTVLDAVTDAAIGQHVEVFDAGYCTLAAELFRDAHDEIALRVLSRCLMAVGGLEYPPRQSSLETVLTDLKDKADGSRTLGGCLIARRGGSIEIVREAGRIGGEAVVLQPGHSVLWDGRFRVRIEGSRAEKPEDGIISVRPLLADGWTQVKENVQPCRRAVREGLVSFWRDGRVIAAPHLGYRNERLAAGLEFFADFCGFTKRQQPPPSVSGFSA